MLQSWLHSGTWCDHQAFCPEKGGTLLPWPEILPSPEESEARHVEAITRQAARQISLP